MIRTAFGLAALAAVAATLVAACGQAGDDGRPAASPDLARLVCGDDGARVLTPRAEPRPDGLHLEVTNESEREVHLTLERSPSDAVGSAAPPGPSTRVLTIGPGAWTATCYGDGGSLRTDALEVVDTGIWVSTELTDCETPQSVHGDPPRRIRASEEELAEVARGALDAFVDLEPGYTLERAGYPEQRETVFRARSGDRTVATYSLYPDDSGGWVAGDATECEDPGPSESEPGP